MTKSFVLREYVMKYLYKMLEIEICVKCKPRNCVVHANK